MMERNDADGRLMPALISCLEGLLASDEMPEGLMRGEIGWLNSEVTGPEGRPVTGLSGNDEMRGVTGLGEERGEASSGGRGPALRLAAAAAGLLPVLEDRGEIAADSALQLRRALDDAVGRIGAAARRAQAARIRGLYVIIDPEVTGGREPVDIARAAINGGARMLQLRDKLRDKGEQLPLATALRNLCAANDALLIINDHADLAAALGPEHVGLHVGQTDLPVSEARKILSPVQVLGRSNREIELIAESQQMGVDHVAFGPMYTTTTKQLARAPQGVERLKQARAVAQVPLVAIGGISVENVAAVVEAGADAVCVTAAVGSAANPEAAAAELTDAIRAAGGRV